MLWTIEISRDLISGETYQEFGTKMQRVKASQIDRFEYAYEIPLIW